MKYLIGITGPAQSGKDTVADVFVTSKGYKKLSFADPIREMLLCLGLEEKYFKEPLKDSATTVFGCSPRELMQTLGTEWGREKVCPDIWVKVMERQWSPYSVIPDVRFEDEAAFIRKHGVLIHVRRRGGPRIERHNHKSEDGVKFQQGDYMLVNQSSLVDFRKEAEEFIRRLA